MADVAEGTYDEINRPAHYNAGKIEAVEVIEDWKLSYNLGNVVKYIARCQHKGNIIKDLQKAEWYLKREFGVCEVDSPRYEFMRAAVILLGQEIQRLQLEKENLEEVKHDARSR